MPSSYRHPYYSYMLHLGAGYSDYYVGGGEVIDRVTGSHVCAVQLGGSVYIFVPGVGSKGGGGCAWFWSGWALCRVWRCCVASFGVTPVHCLIVCCIVLGPGWVSTSPPKSSRRRARLASARVMRESLVVRLIGWLGMWVGRNRAGRVPEEWRRRA
jgi:hypothetical protein